MLGIALHRKYVRNSEHDIGHNYCVRFGACEPVRRKHKFKRGVKGDGTGDRGNGVISFWSRITFVKARDP